MQTSDAKVFTTRLFGGLEKAQPDKSVRSFRSWGTRHGTAATRHEQVAQDHADNGKHDEAHDAKMQARNARLKSDAANHNAKKVGFRAAMGLPNLASIWTGGGR